MSKSNLIIHGGLGNQLFQFFFALNKLNGDTKSLRIIIAKKKHSYQLEIFDILKSDKIEDIQIIRINSIFYKLISKINYLPTFILKKISFLITDNNSFSLLKSKKEPFLIYGYFQDLRLINEQIVSDFIFEDLKANNYCNSNGSTLGIHIRRGDYLNKDHLSTHGLISIKYLIEKCADVLVNFRTVKIYSDSDIKNEFLKYIKIYLGNEYLKRSSLSFCFDNKVSDKDVFLDMAKNDILISTNSTFSYWAGFISSKVKRIYLPNQWHFSKKINKGLIYSKVTLY